MHMVNMKAKFTHYTRQAVHHMALSKHWKYLRERQNTNHQEGFLTEVSLQDDMAKFIKILSNC